MKRWLPLLLLTCACTAGADTNAKRESAPSCATPQLVARLPDELDEASGVAVSRRHAGVLWAHNDSGEPILFALDTLGNLLARISVDARNGDWEDIAAGPCGGADCLYIGAIGDNLQHRSDRVIYRVPEPSLDAGRITPTDSFRYRLPNGPQDAEAFFVLPDERMLLISKGRRGPVTLFSFPVNAPDSMVTLQPLQTLTAGLVQLPDMITAAGATPDGSVIVMRSYSAMQLYTFDGARLTPLLAATGVDLQPLAEFQGEGADINAEGTVYLVSEKGLEDTPPPLSKVHCTGLLP
jgi:hypothetical protein